jgi:hypothetical protein
VRTLLDQLGRSEEAVTAYARRHLIRCCVVPGARFVTSLQLASDARAAVRRDRLARADIHPVSSGLGNLGVAIALDWQFR